MSLTQPRQYYWIYSENNDRVTMPWLQISTLDNSYGSNLKLVIANTVYQGATAIGYVDMGYNTDQVLARNEDWLVLTSDIYDFATYNLSLSGVEYITAPLNKTVDLEVISKFGFGTNGSLHSITTGVGNHTIDYDGATRDSTLTMLAGWDTVNLIDHPDIPGTQYWTLIRRDYSELDAYSLFSGYRIRMESGGVSMGNNLGIVNYGEIERIFLANARSGSTRMVDPGNEYPSSDARSLDTNIDLRSYELVSGSVVNKPFSDSFNLAYFNFIRYTSDNIWSGQATIYDSAAGRYSTPGNTSVDGAEVLDVIGTQRNGTHDLVVTEQANLIDGKFRLYAFNLESRVYNVFNDVYLGTAGVDGKSYSTNAATPEGRVALYGFGGKDILTGGAGNDYLFGGEAEYNQLVSGATGNQLTGGPGADYFGVGNTNANGDVDGAVSWAGYNGGQAQIGYAADQIMDWHAGTDTLRVLSNGVGIISGLYGVSGMAGANTIDLRATAAVVTSDQNNSGPRGGTTSGWDSVAGNLDYIYANQATRDAESIKNEADVTVVNEGLIVARGLEGNDVIYGSPGNDYLYGNQGDNTLDLSSGGADRAFYDTRSGKQFLGGFASASNDKVYLAKNVIDAFRGGETFTELGFTYTVNKTVVDTATDGWTYTYKNGEGYSQGIDFLYGVTYKAYLSNSFGSQPYSNVESQTMGFAADVTTFVAGAVMIGVAVGLCFIPFVGPALAAPLFVSGALLEAGKIYSEVGNKSLGSVEHLNATYDLGGGNNFQSNYAYVLHNDLQYVNINGVNTTPTVPSTTPASGGSANIDNVPFLHFFHGAYTYDGFTPVLELNPGWGYGGDSDNGVHAYFIVYSNTETFVYFVTSQDNLIENGEAFKVAEVNGHRSASDFVVYDSNQDPYNQRADAPVVLKKPTISAVYENSAPTYTASVPNKAYTESPSLRVTGTIASIDPSKTPTTSTKNIVLYDVMQDPDVDGNPIPVATVAISNGDTSFSINDPRSLGQIIIQTDFDTSGSTTAADGSLSQPVKSTGQLRSLELDNTFEYQDRRISYYTSLLNDVDGDGSMIIEIRSNTWNVIDNGPSNATVNGGNGSDTLQLESTSLHLNRAIDAQIVSIENINVKAPNGPGLSVSVSGGQIADVTVIDPNVMVANGTYTLQFKDSDGTYTDPSTAWTLTVLDRQVTAITKGNGGSGFSDTGSYVTADWIPLGVNIDVRAQTEGFNINAYNGADTIVGAQGNDNIYGLAGNDTIDGGNGNDTITGGVGLDSLLGGNGADIFVISAVSDFANGEVIAGGANSAGTVDKLQLSQQAVVGTFGAFISLPSTGTYTAAQLSSQVTGVEVIELTVNASYSLTLSDGIYAGVDANGDGTADNTLTITPTVNITNDVTIVGGAVSGNNELVVQDSGYLDGNDSMVGGAGNDSLQGGDGNDTLVGGIGHNLLQGGNGNDSILGDVGNDSLQGGNGNDSLTGGAGVDSISGGDNNDTIVMAVNLTSADTIDGGAGSDTLTFTDSNGAATDLDNVTFVETIILGNAATTVTTVQGLIGATATLTVDGTALSGVALTWNGSAETDGGKFSITGGTGDDSITGGNGADTLLGSDGNDTLIGGDGADSILGGNHNDEVRVASAAALDLDSTIVGGSGTDTVHITSADLTIADVNFTDVDSVEILRLTGASSVTLGSEATAAGITNVRTGTGATSVTRTDTTTTTVDATDLGNDTTLTLGDIGVTTNFTVTNLTGDLDSSSVAGNLTIRVSDNTVDNDIAINLSESSTTITGGVVGDTLLITQVDDPAVTGIQVIDLTANLSNATIAMGGGRQTIKVGVGIYAINPGSGDAAGEDRVEFNVAGSAAVPTDLSVDDATLLTRINSINNYNADEIDFTNTDTTGANLSITTAGGTFTTNIDGLVTNFGAVTADLGDKISAVRAALDTWSGLAGNDNNRIVLFTHANGASTDTYAYGSGSVAAGDDQIVRIVDDSLNQITTGSSFVLNVAPPTSALTTATSLLPGNTTWYSGSTTVAYSNFTPGNDGTTGGAGDGVTGNTNQLIRNSAGNFGAQQGGGDDYFTTISVPNSMWSTGLNMFGTVYTQIMMGSNGYITFGSGFRGYVPSGIDTYTRSPMIAAQFDDLYTNAGNRNVADGAGPSGTSLGTHQMYFFQDANRLVFTWDNVGLYSNGVSDSQTSAGGVGSAFQIILHKPVGEAADVQNFGIEIRYEEVTLQYSSATAGWTAGDRINYALINPSKTNLASTAFQSNVGINGVWAWLVSGGFITASTYLPDVGLTSPKDTNSVLVRGFNATGYTLGGEAASQFTVAPGSAANTATITTIANATFNLWKDQYVDEVATLTVRPTGPSGVGALETINLSLVRNTDLDGRIDGVDLAVRTAGSAVITVAAGGTLDDAADADLGQTIGAFPAITTITATGSGSTINISSQSEDYTLNGNSGVDIITGGSGSDTITGGGGADQLLGGAGNGDDVFIIASAADHAAGEVITGGSHVVGDQVRFTSTSAQTLTLLSTVTEIEEVRISNAAGSTSGVTNESINASAVTGNIALTGNNGNNTLTGNDGNNTIDGGGGADTLLGGNGNDAFLIDAGDVAAGERYDGGDGTDDQLRILASLDLSGLNDSVNSLANVEVITLNDGVGVKFSAAFLTGETLALNGTGDNLQESVTVVGTAGSDVMDLSGITVDTNDIGGLLIDGAGIGPDTIVGTNGADTILGGTHSDSLLGGAGNDSIVASGVDDTLKGGLGVDYLSGGTGNDVFVFDSANDTTTVNSVAAMDTIAGASYGDQIDLSAFPSYVSGTLEIDLDASGNGDDYILSWSDGSKTYYVYLPDTGLTDGIAGSDDGTGLITLEQPPAPSPASEILPLLSGASTRTYVTGAVTNAATEFKNGDSSTRIELSMGAIDAMIGWHFALGFSKQSDFDTLFNLTSSSIPSGTPDVAVISELWSPGGYPSGYSSADMSNPVRVDAMLESLAWGSDAPGLAVTTDGVNTYIYADIHFDRKAENLATIGINSGNRLYQRPLTGASDAALILTITGLTQSSIITLDDFVISGEVIKDVTTTANTSLTGTSGHDGIHGGPGNDTLRGAAGDDFLTGDGDQGTDGIDWFVIDSGHDRILDLAASNTTDVIQVTAGAVVDATAYGNWTASANSSNSGSATIDARGKILDLTNVSGPNGWWLKDTSTSATSITGSAFSDTIVGGGGVDSLLGDMGDDVFVIYSNVSDTTGVGETMSGGAGNDTLIVAGGTQAINLSDDTLNSIEVLELTRTATGAADSNAQALTMTQAQISGLTTINAALGDVITLTDAVLVGTMQTLTVEGQLTLRLANVASNFLTLDPGNFDAASDLLVLDAASLTQRLDVVGTGELEGALSVVSGSGDDVIYGTQSAVGDTIVTFGGNDYIIASEGDDSVDAGDGNDTLLGGADHDFLTGGIGNDSLMGGAGVDRFVVDSGTDTVTDLGGSDTLAGANQADVLVVSNGATANVTVTDDWNATADTANYGGTVTLILAENDARAVALVTAAVDGTQATWRDGIDIDLSDATGTAGYIVDARGTINTPSSPDGGTTLYWAGTDITGSDFADTIYVGPNGSALALGVSGGSDTVVLTLSGLGSGGQTPRVDGSAYSGVVRIVGFATTGDTIKLSTGSLTTGAQGSGAAGQASISSSGLAIFDIADDTLTELLNAVESGLSAATPVAGEFAFWVSGGNTHIFVSDGVAGIGANDILVQLVGVNATAITLSGGQITGWA